MRVVAGFHHFRAQNHTLILSLNLLCPRIAKNSPRSMKKRSKSQFRIAQFAISAAPSQIAARSQRRCLQWEARGGGVRQRKGVSKCEQTQTNADKRRQTQAIAEVKTQEKKRKQNSSRRGQTQTNTYTPYTPFVAVSYTPLVIPLFQSLVVCDLQFEWQIAMAAQCHCLSWSTQLLRVTSKNLSKNLQLGLPLGQRIRGQTWEDRHASRCVIWRISINLCLGSACPLKHRQTEKQTDRQTERETDRQTDRTGQDRTGQDRTDRQAGRQADRQTNSLELKARVHRPIAEDSCQFSHYTLRLSPATARCWLAERFQLSA